MVWTSQDFLIFFFPDRLVCLLIAFLCISFSYFSLTRIVHTLAFICVQKAQSWIFECSSLFLTGYYVEVWLLSELCYWFSLQVYLLWCLVNRNKGGNVYVQSWHKTKGRLFCKCWGMSFSPSTGSGSWRTLLQTGCLQRCLAEFVSW